MDVSVIKKVLVLVVVLSLFSCKKEEKVPENILSKEKMVSLLIDLRIAEGRVATLTLSNDSSLNLFGELENKIFEDHGVDSLAYITSYQHYLLRPRQALYITDAVIDSLKVIQQIKETGHK
ncbi:MAG: DUF4296 domain-containing protein [Roseivirga sp.]|nr:DUF4296 domain-containing protein [Roseivirga sp.]